VGVELPFTQRPDSKQKPNFISLTGSNAKNLFVVWEDGFLRRYDLINTYEDPTEQIVEERNLLAGDDESVKITQIEMFLGNETLLVGDSTGRVSCWFTAQYKPERTGSADDKKRTGDNRKLFETHVFPGEGSQVTAYGISQRMRNLAVGYADGHVNYYQVTTEQRMFSVTLDDERPVQVISISPKADGMYIGTDEKLWRADIEEGHPEATLASLFLPVWYESYPDPIHMWQSSSATQDTEPKLGLMPLIFGTLKATFYSMIFGAPLALLAAIFTSEFLHPGVRARIKPIIELMASLPSVVLGFLAALVFAPEVTRWLASVLSSFFIFPFLLLLSAFIWQLLPRRMGLLLSGFRFPIMFVVLLATIPICLWLGGPVEMWLFGGDVIDWLKAEQGRGVGGWIYLLLPVSALAALGLVTTFINPWLRQASANWSRPTFAWVNLLKFVSGTVLAIAVAAAVAYFLSYGVGWDPRGRYSMIGNFDPRNSLVVGFVMGFAIIPIIYTIADDALNSVPSHLRSASLGAGATPWQTAMRIVIPTAMSGLFSAVMIGLGRAVGETMIVLMALGNTPIMEISLFNGARTLSANIAVELPEAVQYSTHYRTLFMCALVLFVMTFILNTVAEVVRLRFRKRAYQL